MTNDNQKNRLKRLTHEPPQGLYERLHNTAIVKNREVYLREVGDGGEDISLCNYCVAQCKQKCGVDFSHVPIDEFAVYMDCDCPVSWLYLIAIGAAELRQKLEIIENLEERNS